MPNPRKQIILNEIHFWKQNKLLPEHYCDFLMTLYSEGNELEKEDKSSHKKAVKAKEKRQGAILNSFLFLVALLLILLLFAFQQITLYLLIVISLLALCSIVGAFYFSKKNGLLAPILQIISALFVFGISVKISITYFPDNQNVLYSLLIVNCILWLGTGLLSRLVYFIVSGSLGLVVLISFKLFFS